MQSANELPLRLIGDLTVGQFVNFRIRTLFLPIQLLKCETSRAFLLARFYGGFARSR
jgi:hypothetical protein